MNAEMWASSGIGVATLVLFIIPAVVYTWYALALTRLGRIHQEIAYGVAYLATGDEAEDHDRLQPGTAVVAGRCTNSVVTLLRRSRSG
jgi:hypothetical protein